VRETLALVDRAAIMFEGRIIASGTPAEIVKNEDVRRVYLGDDFDLPAERQNQLNQTTKKQQFQFPTA
jgi:ABC-type proline/glycine betaine transport system ATPase subunit